MSEIDAAIYAAGFFALGVLLGMWLGRWKAQVEAQRQYDAIAERDAARALLGEALPWVGHMSDNPDIGLRARIAAQLEPKP